MYLALKTVHILAVVMFFGNIVTGVLWKELADRSHEPQIIAHTLRTIIRLDRWITVPSVVVIIAAGVAAALIGHLPLLGTRWILWSVILFSVAGAIFGMRVAPLQRRLCELAQTGATSDSMDWDVYRRLSAAWFAWGLAATLTPGAALVLMVFKPV